MNKDWLREIKIGDIVIVHMHRNPDTIDVVLRLTKTQIILKKTNNKYRRSTGIMIGSDMWNMSAIYEATDEKIIAIKINMYRRKLIMRIDTINADILSTEQLENIVQILEKK